MLFYQLLKRGNHGELLIVIRSMYDQLKTCVQTINGLTKWFECCVDTQQWCMVSPFLFSLYLNELIEMLSNERGIQISDQYPNVNILLYADDLLVCADTVGNLH